MPYICESESCRSEIERPDYAAFTAGVNYEGEVDGNINCDCGYGVTWCDDCYSSEYCSHHNPHSRTGEVVTSPFSNDIEWVKPLVTTSSASNPNMGASYTPPAER